MIRRALLAFGVTLFGLLAVAGPAEAIEGGPVSIYVPGVAPSQVATQAALNLFVDPAGNDASACDGTGAAACATIPGAVNKVPKRIRHPVTITVANGFSGAGAAVEGFSCEPSTNAATGAWLDIRGTFTTAALTGAMTGTLASATTGTNNTWNTVTVTGAGWTVSQLRGQLLEFTGGACAGDVEAIYDNTATVITTASFGWSANLAACTPDATTTFAIRDWGSTINTGLTLPQAGPPGVLGSQSASGSFANEAGFLVGNIRSSIIAPRTGSTSTPEGCVFISRFKFTTARAIESAEANGVVYSQNRLSGMASGGFGFYGGWGALVRNTANMTTGSTSFAYAQQRPHLNQYVLMNGNVKDGVGTFFGHDGTGGSVAAEGTFQFRSNSSKGASPSVADIRILRCVTECIFQGDKIEGSSQGGIALGVGSNTYQGFGRVAFAGLTIDAFTAGAGLVILGDWRVDAFSTDPWLGTGTGTSTAGIVLNRGAQVNLPSGVNTLAGVGGAVQIGMDSALNIYRSYASITTAKTICSRDNTCIRDSTGAAGGLDRVEELGSDAYINAAIPAGATTWGAFQYDRPVTVTAVSVYVSGASGAGAGNTVVDLQDAAASNICRCNIPCAGGAGVGSNAVGTVKATCALQAGAGCVFTGGFKGLITTSSSGCTTTQPTVKNLTTYVNRD